jgi:hypothetical protein
MNPFDPPCGTGSIIRRHLRLAETIPFRHTPHGEPKSLSFPRCLAKILPEVFGIARACFHPGTRPLRRSSHANVSLGRRHRCGTRAGPTKDVNSARRSGLEHCRRASDKRRALRTGWLRMELSHPNRDILLVAIWCRFWSPHWGQSRHTRENWPYG